jgi:hypothetical protein
MHVLTTATCSVPHRYAALPGVQSHGVSVRVMNYFCNMNSKTLFRFMLDDATLMARHRPVSIHINYHPEKLPRMEDVFQHFYGAADDVDLGAGLGLPTKRNASIVKGSGQRARNCAAARLRRSISSSFFSPRSTRFRTASKSAALKARGALHA